MLKFNRGAIAIILVVIATTAIAVYYLGGLNPDQIQLWLRQSGIWAPIIFIAIYTIATLLILPSTVLNLTSGAIFGPWLGTLWTSIAAIVAAVVAFTFTRTWGRQFVVEKLGPRLQAVDAEMMAGGLFYMFAIRLQPILPYGLVNFAAGLTAISFRDYFIGTALGTVPGVLPFVMLGSYGLRAVKTGDMLPLLGALLLTAMLIVSATWYRRQRRNPRRLLEEIERSHPPEDKL
jgi:uncharacterized membrane protein YdjX (TVP38/TMEM64 family)